VLDAEAWQAWRNGHAVYAPRPLEPDQIRRAPSSASRAVCGMSAHFRTRAAMHISACRAKPRGGDRSGIPKFRYGVRGRVLGNSGPWLLGTGP